MIKAILFISIIGLSFTSCKKCRTCSYYDSQSNTEFSSGEVCGKDEVDKMEKEYKARADSANAELKCI